MIDEFPAVLGIDMKKNIAKTNNVIREIEYLILILDG